MISPLDDIAENRSDERIACFGRQETAVRRGNPSLSVDSTNMSDRALVGFSRRSNECLDSESCRDELRKSKQHLKT